MRLVVPRYVSFDKVADLLLPDEGPLQPPETLLQRVREISQEDPETMSRLFALLPAIDWTICYLYFIDGVTQEGVSDLLGIGQPEVSGRLHSCLKPLVFLARRPTHNPVQVKTDLSTLLPDRLVEAALLLYLNFHLPSRVAELLGPNISESTVRNRREQVETHLQELAALLHGDLDDQASLGRLGLIDGSGVALENDELASRAKLASRYLEDLRRADKVSARFWRPFRKNEAVRANALVKGEPIEGPPTRGTKAKRFAGARGGGTSAKR